MEAQKYRVLILEDETDLGIALRNALQGAGLEAASVTSVRAAIKQLEAATYDIVVSDIHLPEETGLDFFHFAHKSYPNLPFIFITGYPSLEMAVQSLKNGAYDYLSKPFELDKFVERVKEVIHKSRKRQNEENFVNDLREIVRRRIQDLQIYQDIFKSQSDGYLILDVEGTVIETNPAFTRLSGLREDVLLKKPFSWISERLFPELDFNELSKVLRKNGKWQNEISARNESGNQWTAALSMLPIYDEAHTIFAYVLIASDKTEIRQVQTALINSLEKTNLAQEAVIFGMARLAEYRDKDTGYHLERMRNYCKFLAEALQQHPPYRDQISQKFIDMLYRAAPLHDIGKVGIPDSILLKSEKLSEEEYRIMCSHTTIGYETLSSIRQQYGEMDFLDMGIEITWSHHERYDGKGYPRGLKGEEIPLSAQIVAIADVYDALTSKRCYKKAFSHQASVNTIKMQRGKHFSPDLLDIFLTVADQFDEIRRTFLDSKASTRVLSAEQLRLINA